MRISRTQAPLPAGTEGVDRAWQAVCALGGIALIARETETLSDRDASRRGDGIGRTGGRNKDGGCSAGVAFNCDVGTGHGGLCGSSVVGCNHHREGDGIARHLQQAASGYNNGGNGWFGGRLGNEFEPKRDQAVVVRKGRCQCDKMQQKHRSPHMQREKKVLL
jgi:hypothetical protein